MELEPAKYGMERPGTHPAGNCLGRTCLQWSCDGELSGVDLELVLERLALVDQDMAAERQRSSNREPCPSTS